MCKGKTRLILRLVCLLVASRVFRFEVLLGGDAAVEQSDDAGEQVRLAGFYNDGGIPQRDPFGADRLGRRPQSGKAAAGRLHAFSLRPAHERGARTGLGRDKRCAGSVP
jgi:hypothetical protein